MLRTLIAVVAGYIVMALCVMVLYTAYYFLLGADGAYRQGSFEVTGLWIAGSFVLSFVAAYVGGYATAAAAKNQTAPRILTGIIVALGLILAFTYSPEGAGAVRTGDVGIMDAMSLSVEPKWVAFLTPFIGAAGVLLGASRVRTVASEPDLAPDTSVDIAPAGPVGPAAPPPAADDTPRESGGAAPPPPAAPSF